jgi:predicted MFS family arabinose efflux permease
MTLPIDTQSTPVTPSGTSTRSPWWGVVSLTIVLFALVTSEFLPASLLSPIAADLKISPGLAGQAVSVTAIMGAIAAPTIGVIFPRLDRRTLMLGLAALAIISNVVVSLASSYPVLLVARLLLGVAVAGFWSVSLALVAHLVSPARLGRGMTVVNIGVSGAMIVAIPLGTYLGEVLGWRAVFLLAAAASFLALVLVAFWLPSAPAAPGAGGRSLIATLRSPLVIFGLVGVAFAASGHFAAFTYIRPALERTEGLGATALAAFLIAFGVTGLVGNLFAGPIADRRLAPLVLLSTGLVAIGAVVLAVGGANVTTALIGVTLWGLGFGGLPTATQTWVARSAPQHLDAIGGLIVTVFQIAIALGAGVGGALVDGLNVQAALVAGGIASGVGGVLLASRTRSLSRLDASIDGLASDQDQAA